MAAKNGIIAGITGLLFTALIAAPTMDVFKSLTWMDQQRNLQIGMIMLASLGLLLQARTMPLLSAHGMPRFLLVATLLIAFVSALFASSGEWAFTELALWLGLCGLFTFSASICRQNPKILVIYQACALIVAALLCLQFIILLVDAFASGTNLEAKKLLNGFENLRWLGQFQALSIPLIGGIWLIARPGLWQRLILALLVCWWITIWAGESRGAWLALITVLGLAAFLKLGPPRYYVTLLVSAVIGLICYLLIFQWLAPTMGLSMDSRDLETLVSSSSLRKEMWLATLVRIPEHPVLGWGGMAFAGSDAFFAGHPHNALLQVAYEWGLPVLAGCLGLLFIAILRLWPQVRQLRHWNEDHPLFLTTLLSLAVMLAHSMVSGVIVMPYSQTWLALLAGALWAMTSGKNQQTTPPVHSRAALALCLVAISSGSWLTHVALRDYDRLTQFEKRPGYGTDAPRFWLRGGIRLKDSPQLVPALDDPAKRP